MAALILFGKKLQIGSDDIVFPYSLITIARSGWALMLFSILLHYLNDSSCPLEFLSKVHLSICVALQACLCCVEAFAAFLSSRGCIAEPSPRRLVPAALYIQACLLAMELGWSMVGIILAHDQGARCGANLRTVTTLALVWSLLEVLGVVACLRFGVGVRGMIHQGKHDCGRPAAVVVKGRRLSRVNKRSATSRYEGNLACFFDLLNKRGRTEALQSALHNSFSSEGRVPSDITAGLSLIAISDEAPDDLPQKSVDFKNDSSNNNLVRLLRYLRFVNASYGWQQHCIDQGCLRGFESLWKNYSLHQKTAAANNDTTILGDDSHRMNTLNLAQTLGINEPDIIYALFQSEVFCPAFYVVYDHGESSVVVVIRGSLSLQDALTDLNDHSSLLTTVGSLDIYAHKGTMIAAHTLQLKLDANNVLEKAFQKYPHYKLVLVGHSFGAGCASLLAILLKYHYPHLHCYAFAPFGSLINIEAVYYTRIFITTLVVGSDIISRLSQRSFEALREKVEYYIHTCKAPKYQIFLGTFLYQMGIYKWSQHLLIGQQTPLSSDDSTLGNDEEIIFEKPSSNIKGAGDKGHGAGSLEPNAPLLEAKEREHVPLFIAGRIIHITKKNPEKARASNTLSAHWVPPTNFTELFIDQDMFYHHLPDVMHKTLTALLRQENVMFEHRA